MSITSDFFKKKPKAISFDWDGTLGITHDLLIEAVNHVLKIYSLPDYKVTRQKGDSNRSFKENFPLFFGNEYKNAYEEYLSYYNYNCVSRVNLFDKAYDFVKTSNDCGIDVLIISNKEKSILLNEVKKCFPDNPFKEILGNGDTKLNKPSPEPLIKAYSSISKNINPDDFWHIGDSNPDYEASIKANALPIIIHNEKFKEKCHIFKDFSELSRTISW